MSEPKQPEGASVGVVCIVASIAILVGMFFGISVERHISNDGDARMKAELVKHGAAVWEVDPETGRTKWKWKEDAKP